MLQRTSLFGLFAMIAILIGAGHPTYLWPDAEQIRAQDISDELRLLIPDR